MAEENENTHSFFDNLHLLNVTTFATSQRPTRRLSVTPRSQELFFTADFVQLVDISHHPVVGISCIVPVPSRSGT